MKESKIKIGQKVQGKSGYGVITKIITKSTGYVEVDYNGVIKKEMAFNLTDENGISLKAKPASNHDEKLREKLSVTSFVEGGFDSLFASRMEKEKWLEERESAKWGCLSSCSR